MKLKKVTNYSPKRVFYGRKQEKRKGNTITDGLDLDSSGSASTSKESGQRLTHGRLKGVKGASLGALARKLEEEHAPQRAGCWQSKIITAHSSSHSSASNSSFLLTSTLSLRRETTVPGSCLHRGPASGVVDVWE